MNQDRSTSGRIVVIDSHTAGEPTRVVVEGGPPLGTGPLSARCRRFQAEFDRFRSAVVNEPHGSDVIVGALLVPPEDPAALAQAVARLARAPREAASLARAAHLRYESNYSREAMGRRYLDLYQRLLAAKPE